MEGTNRRQSKLALAGALLVVGSCTALTVTANAATLGRSVLPAAGELRSCGTRGESSTPQRPPTPDGIAIGPLTLWPTGRTDVEAVRNGPWRYAVKAPVVLPAGKKVVLAIAPRATELAAFQSARRPGVFVSSVRFEACRKNEQTFPGSYRGVVGALTGFPFGIVLAARPACIPMEVWVEGAAKPFRHLVPFGRRSCYR